MQQATLFLYEFGGFFCFQWWEKGVEASLSE
jgi:hypothetical protein